MNVVTVKFEGNPEGVEGIFCCTAPTSHRLIVVAQSLPLLRLSAPSPQSLRSYLGLSDVVNTVQR